MGKKIAFFQFYDERTYYVGDEVMLLLGKKQNTDLNLEGAVSPVCFGSSTTFEKEEDLLRIYVNSTFPIVLVFQFVFEAECMVQVKSVVVLLRCFFLS